MSQCRLPISSSKPTTAESQESSLAPPASSSSSQGCQFSDRLPQPQNSNHISTAPFKDKLLTNSSYLAAEIPLKLGHFVNHLWTSGSELSSSFFLQQQQQGCDDPSLWLLGRRYEMSNMHLDMQADILDAQKSDIFKPPTANEPEVTPRPPSETTQNQVPTYALSVLWPPDFYDDFTSRIWMTYRYNYPPIRPSNHKTDIGWGCMLRSGQSLLANALLTHFLGRDWRRSQLKGASRQEYRRILHWFLDELSPRAPFSIHRIALLGKQLGKNIGEWFGPNTISQVIQALVSDFPPANMAVYIATDGVVYHDDVQDVARGKKSRGEFTYFPTRTASPEADGLDEARKLYTNSNTNVPKQSVGPFKPILILIAIRLGIDNFHPLYHAALKAYFELPNFVGVAGGRPNSSLYFIGLQGDELIYLDPHFSRPALETKSLAEYTEADFATYHCTIPRKVHISHLDPSMMLGFYCSNESEFHLFCERISEIARQCTPIFTIEQRAPEYNEDVRSENDFGIVSDDEPEFSEDDAL
ncbi:uncharacterized protein BYT42DRAFT_327482 [Radiomyces spectabilis]|uniref:uncharacterized protein n=1 Tax=Radiomyces spectabilis TaxID=64574 RepID=UPI00221EA62D|nr:uncharacterized protein BYT42DRAFT_327482 [Radiomyces spectabilis]KAI8379448.1 hypothetical protein BYT42DRAFT_327482 [Radiomyces spectabilis]